MCILENSNGKNIWNHLHAELGVKLAVDLWMTDHF